MERYFMVVCHRGHCGTGKGTEIKFAIAAQDILSACDIARKMPSVKHTKLAIFAKEINEVEYLEYKKISAYERYPMQKAQKKRRGY